MNGYNAVQNVGNPVVHNVGNQNRIIVVLGIANPNANQNGNGNVVAARAEGNGNGNHENQIWCYNCKGLGYLASKHRHRILRLTKLLSMTQMDELRYTNMIIVIIMRYLMFTQEGQHTDLLEPILKPHQVQQNDSDVIFVVSNVEQDGGLVEQNPAIVEETRALYDSLYNNLAIEVEKVNMVNRKMK
nr:hypothetical protein [Tanacetum cinerariifolium]